jgi:hypothetical protein
MGISDESTVEEKERKNRGSDALLCISSTQKES